MLNDPTKLRVLVVSSTRAEWFESQDTAVHYQHAPYSLGAIMKNLEPLGWQAGWAGWQTASNAKRLAERIDAFRPHIIYTYGSTTALKPLYCRRRLTAWKDFKVVHGWDDLYGDIWNDLFGWPGRVFMDHIERRIVTESDHVITLSYFLQQRGRKWGVESTYIPNGADPVDTSVLKGTIKLDGKMNLVYTGDQARWKRTADICEAMRHVPKDIKLYLTGQHYKYLDKYASDNCIFLGYVSKEEQLNVMNQADVFVLTADQDCNAKLHEYLRWGKPILGYDGRLNLILKNNRNALLTRDYPPAIMTLYHNPALRTKLAAHATEDVPVMAWSEIAKLFDAAFRSFIRPSS